MAETSRRAIRIGSSPLAPMHIDPRDTRGAAGYPSARNPDALLTSYARTTSASMGRCACHSPKPLPDRSGAFEKPMDLDRPFLLPWLLIRQFDKCATARSLGQVLRVRSKVVVSARLNKRYEGIRSRAEERLRQTN